MVKIDPTCYARNTDPETSHLAAEKASKVTATSEKLQLCLWAVTRWVGLTAEELRDIIRKAFPKTVASWGGEKTGSFIHRGLPMLRKQKLICNGKARI